MYMYDNRIRRSPDFSVCKRPSVYMTSEKDYMLTMNPVSLAHTDLTIELWSTSVPLFMGVYVCLFSLSMILCFYEDLNHEMSINVYNKFNINFSLFENIHSCLTY